MPAATFFADHGPSNSRAVIEFQLRDKQVRLSAIYFIQGNVVDLSVIRACMRRSRLILPTGANWPPCVQDDPFPNKAR